MPKQLQLVERGTWEDNNEAESFGIIKTMVTEARAVKDNPMALDFVISSARRDRDNDVIKVDGWDTKQWETNPVVLWSHSHGEPPVAKGFNLRTKKGKVLCSAEFTPHDVNPFGYMIYRMYQQGFLKATSVGFRPLKWNRLPEEKEKGEGDDGSFTQLPGFEFEKQELLEWSAVPVGANPDALLRAAEAKVDLRPMRAWCERFLDGERMGKAGVSRDQVVDAWKACAERGFWIEIDDEHEDEVVTMDSHPDLRPLTMPLLVEAGLAGEPGSGDTNLSGIENAGVIVTGTGTGDVDGFGSRSCAPDEDELRIADDACEVEVSAALNGEGEYELSVDGKLLARIPADLLANFPDGLVAIESKEGGDDEEEEAGEEEGSSEEEGEKTEASAEEQPEAGDEGDDEDPEGAGEGEGVAGADDGNGKSGGDADSELEIDFGDEDDEALEIGVGGVEELRSTIAGVLVEELSKALNE